MKTLMELITETEKLSPEAMRRFLEAACHDVHDHGIETEIGQQTAMTLGATIISWCKECGQVKFWKPTQFFHGQQAVEVA